MDDQKGYRRRTDGRPGTRRFGTLIVAVMFGSAARAQSTPSIPRPESVAIPDGERGIGYDDLQYAPGLKRILVPAGRTGRLVLLDPATRAIVSIAGFSSAASFSGGHGQGTTSATELPGPIGRIVATDRGSKTLKLVSAQTSSIVGSIKLAAAPDYVRAVPLTSEVWVTEPAKKQIEVLSLGDRASGRFTHVSNIAVPDGPESLVIDTDRGRAYSHTWAGQSFAIDLRARKVVSTWRNGCRQSRGIALDAKRGWLFAGCAEGKATVVDLATGKVLSTAETGSDVDSIGYNPALGHLYVPGGGSADLSILKVASDGKLTLLGKVPTAADAHTAAIDPASNSVFVGAPEHGAVLVVHDPFPPSQG
jgi:DNA-binding beta-propeller fold protein YncE